MAVIVLLETSYLGAKETAHVIKKKQGHKGDRGRNEAAPEDILPIVRSLNGVPTNDRSNNNCEEHEAVAYRDTNVTILIGHQLPGRWLSRCS